MDFNTWKARIAKQVVLNDSLIDKSQAYDGDAWLNGILKPVNETFVPSTKEELIALGLMEVTK